MREKLNLRWGTHRETVLHSLENSLGAQDFVDLTLACDGQSVQAHKVIVSACSSFLKKLLQENPCPHPVVILKDITMFNLRQLLEFMYCGEVTIEQGQLESLLQAAQSLGIRGLAEVDCTETSGDAEEYVEPMEEINLEASETQDDKTEESSESILASYLLGSEAPSGKSLSLADLLAQPPSDQFESDVSKNDQQQSDLTLDALSEAAVDIKQEVADEGFETVHKLAEDSNVFEEIKITNSNSSAKGVGKATAFMLSLAKRANRVAVLPYSTVGKQSPGLRAGSKQCVFCGQIFRSEESLELHMSITHSKNSSSNSNPASSASSGEGSSELKLAFYEARPCSICGKMYRDAASLRTHVSLMHTKWRDGFECSCKQVFLTKFEMYQHRKTHGKSSRVWTSPS